jgi:hypothetical protein
MRRIVAILRINEATVNLSEDSMAGLGIKAIKD